MHFSLAQDNVKYLQLQILAISTPAIFDCATVSQFQSPHHCLLLSYRHFKLQLTLFVVDDS